MSGSVANKYFHLYERTKDENKRLMRIIEKQATEIMQLKRRLSNAMAALENTEPIPASNLDELTD